MRIELNSSAQTEQLGAALWHALPASGVVFLQGDLGVGKTTLVRGLLRASGHQGRVKSPTYTLVEEYRAGGREIHHFDLYRLNDPEELEWIGIRDYLHQAALWLIEWPDRGEGFLPPADLQLKLKIAGTGRIAELSTDCSRLENSISLNWKNKNILI